MQAPNIILQYLQRLSALGRLSPDTLEKLVIALSYTPLQRSVKLLIYYSHVAFQLLQIFQQMFNSAQYVNSASVVVIDCFFSAISSEKSMQLQAWFIIYGDQIEINIFSIKV